MSYQQKYLKYKKKYLTLKNQIGSALMTARERMRNQRSQPKKRVEFKYGFLINCYNSGKYLLAIDGHKTIFTTSVINRSEKIGLKWEYETDNSIYFSLEEEASVGDVKLKEILQEKEEQRRIRRTKLNAAGRQADIGPSDIP